TSPGAGDPGDLTEDTLLARASFAASQYVREARSVLFGEEAEEDADEFLAASSHPPAQAGTTSIADETEDFEDLFLEPNDADHFPPDDLAVFRDPTSPTADDIIESTFAEEVPV
ncbi:unnamed protein product, partial [Dibothriocephalus latus]